MTTATSRRSPFDDDAPQSITGDAAPAAARPTPRPGSDDEVLTKVRSHMPRAWRDWEDGRNFTLGYGILPGRTLSCVRRQLYTNEDGQHVYFTFELPVAHYHLMVVPKRATRAELRALRYQQ